METLAIDVENRRGARAREGERGALFVTARIFELRSRFAAETLEHSMTLHAEEERKRVTRARHAHTSRGPFPTIFAHRFY